MSAMRELVFEIPLSVTESDFPIALLRRVQILHMLKFGSSGYLFICRISTADWESYERDSSSDSSKKKISISVL